MRSPLCDDCNMAKAIVHCMSHSATFCLQCDWKLHSSGVTLDSHVNSRFLLCSNCVTETADVQWLGQGLYLCKTCVSNANIVSPSLLCDGSNNSNNTFSYTSPLDLDSSSCSSSFFDLKTGYSFVSSPFNNGDSSSPSPPGFFQNFDSYTKCYSDQQQQLVPMPPPDFMDIPKDSLYSGLNGYDTKEDLYNVWLNNFDGDLKEYFPAEDLIPIDQLNINDITKHNSETTTEIIQSSSTCMSSVTHKDYNIEALANGSCHQDYNKNQLIGSKAKEETNNSYLGLFPNPLAQLDCGPSQLILTNEMLSWDDQTLASNHDCNPGAREEAVKRYLAKKKNRKFGKQIRYQSRKSTADTKKRYKGRFTKAGAEYDYDPRANDNNKETNKMIE